MSGNVFSILVNEFTDYFDLANPTVVQEVEEVSASEEKIMKMARYAIEENASFRKSIKNVPRAHPFTFIKSWFHEVFQIGYREELQTCAATIRCMLDYLKNKKRIEEWRVVNEKIEKGNCKEEVEKALKILNLKQDEELINLFPSEKAFEALGSLSLLTPELKMNLIKRVQLDSTL